MNTFNVEVSKQLLDLVKTEAKRCITFGKDYKPESGDVIVLAHKGEVVNVEVTSIEYVRDLHGDLGLASIKKLQSDSALFGQVFLRLGDIEAVRFFHRHDFEQFRNPEVAIIENFKKVADEAIDAYRRSKRDA